MSSNKLMQTKLQYETLLVPLFFERTENEIQSTHVSIRAIGLLLRSYTVKLFYRYN